MSEALRDFNQKKLATIDRIRRDGRLSSSARMVGAELFSLVDFRTGDAWPSELYLAEKLCLAHRTVKMAISSLKAAGYIQVDKRGRSNRYRPIFEAVEQGQGLPLSDADRGKIEHEQGQKTSGNRGKKGPPISLRSTLGPSAPGPADRDGALEGADAPASNQPGDRLGGFAAAIQARIGAQHFESWFGKAALVGIEGQTVTLAAQNKYFADHIKNFFGGTVVECFKAAHPEVQRIETIVAKGLAAPSVASIGARRNQPSPDARWLVDAGIALVAEHLRVSSDAADRMIVGWLDRCGKDASGLRKIISDAAEQQLVGDNFSNVVKQRTKALLFADQTTLPLSPVALRSTS